MLNNIQSGRILKSKIMTRYILSILIIFSLWACSEDKEVLQLNSAPSVLDYQNYSANVLIGSEWSSGLPLVRGEAPMTYELLSVTSQDTVVNSHEFTIDAQGVVSLPAENTLELGTYIIAIEVSNEFGSVVNDKAISLEIVESAIPVITIQTPSGTNEVDLLINPAGQPVDEAGNVIEGILSGVSLSFENLSIKEVLMSPTDVFSFGRQSDYEEEGSDEIGVVKMVGPFDVGTYVLEFVGTVSQPQPVSLNVNVTKLNLPYDESIFALDLSGEETGPRNDLPENLIAGLQTHLIYGELKSGKAFWNVQADSNHPVAEYGSTPILRWLAFNAATGYESGTANKSQSIAILNEMVDVSNAREVRLDASFVSNKAAELTSGLLRYDLRVCTEEEYQAMLAMTTQAEKKEAVNNWQLVVSSYGLNATAGTNDNTGYGYFEISATIDKAELPVSASNQIRFLFHTVADKDGANPGWIALQQLNIEGTFQDN